MASPFAGLGLGALGQDTRYINTPIDTPGLLQGAIDIPARYLAENVGKPAIDWLQSKLSPVAPPLGAGAPVGAGVNPAYAYAPRIDTANPIQPAYGNADDEIAKQVQLSSQTNIH
jgi:hypothetical protein